jgi:hypothetical protein
VVVGVATDADEQQHHGHVGDRSGGEPPPTGAPTGAAVIDGRHGAAR